MGDISILGRGCGFLGKLVVVVMRIHIHTVHTDTHTRGRL